jgi:multidrug efflux pump
MALTLNIDILERKVYFGGPGGQWWAEMATVIIGGLIFASILTLVLTPSILMIQARVGDWFAAGVRGRALAATATDSGRRGRA